ncbi:hypothetical protein GCM10025865_25160 [Paraoerskovia sediminicola]|uniref:Pyrroloquinoline-quinone binding quinoprotein n=1 Tax=Paraoerskovia sediminicola TaxID=1138587 RepID=A0ABN6XHN0_9CELL|nr:hypothetical protein [Paraoerskovia sediminicola]BDZ43217.1 hypothetical protein GCM10025865_25160 [Paraoerskovia sediminicola]
MGRSGGGDPRDVVLVDLEPDEDPPRWGPGPGPASDGGPRVPDDGAAPASPGSRRSPGRARRLLLAGVVPALVVVGIVVSFLVATGGQEPFVTATAPGGIRPHPAAPVESWVTDDVHSVFPLDGDVVVLGTSRVERRDLGSGEVRWSTETDGVPESCASAGAGADSGAGPESGRPVGVGVAVVCTVRSGEPWDPRTVGGWSATTLDATDGAQFGAQDLGERAAYATVLGDGSVVVLEKHGTEARLVLREATRTAGGAAQVGASDGTPSGWTRTIPDAFYEDVDQSYGAGIWEGDGVIWVYTDRRAGDGQGLTFDRSGRQVPAPSTLSGTGIDLLVGGAVAVGADDGAGRTTTLRDAQDRLVGTYDGLPVGPRTSDGRPSRQLLVHATASIAGRADVVDAATGEQLWGRDDVLDYVARVAGVMVLQERVGGASVLVGLDAVSGAELWTVDLVGADQVFGAFTDGSRVVVEQLGQQGDEVTLRAVDLGTGVPSWDWHGAGYVEDVGGRLLLWRFSAEDDEIGGAPTRSLVLLD